MDRRNFLTSLMAGSFFAGLSVSRSAARAQDLRNLDMMDLAKQIYRGEISPAESLALYQERIDLLNPQINAVVTKSYDYAERQLAAGLSGPLRGVPYLFKDLSDVKGIRTSYGCRAFENNIAHSQAPYVDKVLGTGIGVLGKTNTPEFGLLATTESVYLEATRNPWNTAFSAGGSSGGATAAVAARMVPVAQSSDGGGSIRIPSAACGVFGMKPSRGRFPEQGSPNLPFLLSIKHCSSVTVRDSAFMLALTETGKHLRPVGFVEGPSQTRRRFALCLTAPNVVVDEDTQKAVLEMASALQGAGHDVEEVSDSPLFHPNYVEDFLVLWAMSASRTYGRISDMIGKDAFKAGMVEPWTAGLHQFFTALPEGRIDEMIIGLTALSQRVDAFLSTYDAVISPVTSHVAPRLGYFGADLDFETQYQRTTHYATFTPLHNVAGTPSMSVPGYFTEDGRPVGVQIAAGLGKERMLFEIAYELEEMRPWRDRLPEIS